MTHQLVIDSMREDNEVEKKRLIREKEDLQKTLEKKKKEIEEEVKKRFDAQNKALQSDL